MKRLIGLLLAVWFLDFDASGAFAEVIISSSRTINATPTIDTNIYASGDLLGTKLTFAGAAKEGVGSGTIHTVVISDLDKESANVDLIIFNSNPSATTFSNNSALDIDDADLSKIACVISITTHATFNDNGVSYANGTNCVFEIADASTPTLYGALVVRATPTYTTAADITVRLSILQD